MPQTIRGAARPDNLAALVDRSRLALLPERSQIDQVATLPKEGSPRARRAGAVTGNLAAVAAVTPAGRTSKLPFRFPDTPVRFDPAWAPDGALLAYVVLDVDAMNAWPERTGRSGVYVSSSDGSRPRRIARGSELLAPAWSPDGDWIAFEGAHGISLVRADGTGRHALIKMGSDPAWLPPTR